MRKDHLLAPLPRIVPTERTQQVIDLAAVGYQRLLITRSGPTRGSALHR